MMRMSLRFFPFLLCLLLPVIVLAQGERPDHLSQDIVAAEQQAAARTFSVVSSPLTDRYDLVYHRL